MDNLELRKLIKSIEQLKQELKTMNEDRLAIEMDLNKLRAKIHDKQNKLDDMKTKWINLFGAI